MLWHYFFGVAMAQELPTGEIPEEIGLGCVLRIQGKSPSLRLEEAEYFFHDDGVAPDKIAGDGVFSLFVLTMEEKNIDVQLWMDGVLRWSDSVPLPPKGQQTWLSIDEEKEGSRPIAHVSFRSLSSQTAPTQNPTSYDSGYMIWIAFVVGIVLGFRLRLSLRLPISRWLPHTPHQVHTQILSFPTSDDACVALKKELYGQHILLCTSHQRRDLFTELAASLPVYWGQTEIYEAATLRFELAKIQELGASVVLLDGMHGLMRPTETEEPLVVLNEILQDSSLVVVLVFVGEEVPQGISIPSKRDSHTAENEH